jgi:uncharacterized membrane protein
MRNAFGSWAFVGSFLAFMGAWMILNTALLGRSGFDAYPYILLNLALSMMAGLQGALILIAAKRADRVAAEQATAHYAETDKIDGMGGEVLALQKQQMSLLSGIEHANAELDGIREALAGHAGVLRDQLTALRVEVKSVRSSAQAAHAGVQALADMLPVPAREPATGPDPVLPPTAAGGGAAGDSVTAARRAPTAKEM